jgi:phospholipid transport system substrate-binding protein
MRKATPVLFALTLGMALPLAAPVIASAQASDPAAQQADKFDSALLATMKGGKSLGAEGRYKKLEPAVTSGFDLSAMVRVAVGPAAWTKMSSTDQAALKTAFARFTIANYAHNFSDYSGQKFVTGAVTTRLPDKLVSTQIVNPTGAPIPLAYRMRNSGGGWKIIDVFYNGSISSLAQQSSDFSGTVAKGGAPALIKKLNDQSDKLLAS